MRSKSTGCAEACDQYNESVFSQNFEMMRRKVTFRALTDLKSKWLRIVVSLGATLPSNLETISAVDQAPAETRPDLNDVNELPNEIEKIVTQIVKSPYLF
jgi:hypothetical protein